MRRVSLGSALLAGAGILGIVTGMTPMAVGMSMVGALFASGTLLVSAVVFLIMVLSHFMEKSGQMERLLMAFRGISRNARANLVLFPVLIGLLPMPGGAVFSAPLVEATAREQNLGEGEKALVNYWFRHIWEFSWPLYPGILLTAKLSGISLALLAPANLPMTLAALLLGHRVLLGGVSGRVKGGEAAGGGWRPFLWEFAPIAVTVFGFALLELILPEFSATFPALADLPPEAPLVAALAAAIAWTAAANRAGWATARGIVTQKALWRMVYLIAAIMVFSGVLEDSGTVAAISSELLRWRVPTIAVAVLLPFVVGLVTGVTVAFVGTALPIVLGLASGPEGHKLAYVVLAFMSGYTGVLCTPVHACLALTLAYFSTGFAAVGRKLFALCGGVAASGLALFGVYYAFS